MLSFGTFALEKPRGRAFYRFHRSRRGEPMRFSSGLDYLSQRHSFEPLFTKQLGVLSIPKRAKICRLLSLWASCCCCVRVAPSLTKSAHSFPATYGIHLLGLDGRVIRRNAVFANFLFLSCSCSVSSCYCLVSPCNPPLL